MRRRKIKIACKEWGEEYHFYNGNYCGKRLTFAADHRCSMHFHKIKHEVFLIIVGRILFEYVDLDTRGQYILEVGDTVEVHIGMYHRMTAIGGNAALIEFSSHHEDSDSYRVETGQLWREDV